MVIEEDIFKSFICLMLVFLMLFHVPTRPFPELLFALALNLYFPVCITLEFLFLTFPLERFANI